MLKSSRNKVEEPLTDDNLAKLYDVLLHMQNKRYYRRWEMNTSHMGRRKSRQVVQDDVRLKRTKDRTEGIRFTSGYEDITFR
jgi:hypothetical protein